MKNYDETTDQITLTLDDDSELLCDVIATFPAKVNGKEQMYIALIPTDAEPEDDIFLYRFIVNIRFHKRTVDSCLPSTIRSKYDLDFIGCHWSYPF